MLTYEYLHAIIQKLTRERIDLENPERHCGLVLLK